MRAGGVCHPDLDYAKIMHTRTHTRTTHTCVFVPTDRKHTLFLFSYVHIHIHMHIHMYIHTTNKMGLLQRPRRASIIGARDMYDSCHMCIYTRKYNAYTHTHTHTYKYIHTYMCACVCVHAHTFTHTPVAEATPRVDNRGT